MFAPTPFLSTNALYPLFGHSLCQATKVLASVGATFLDLRVDLDGQRGLFDTCLHNSGFGGSLRRMPVAPEHTLLSFGDNTYLLHAHGRFLPFGFTIKDKAFSPHRETDRQALFTPLLDAISAHVAAPWTLVDQRITTTDGLLPSWHQASGWTAETATLVQHILTLLNADIDGAPIRGDVFNATFDERRGTLQPGFVTFDGLNRKKAAQLERAVAHHPLMQSLLCSPSLVTHRHGVDHTTREVSGTRIALLRFSLEPINAHTYFTLQQQVLACTPSSLSSPSTPSIPA